MLGNLKRALVWALLILAAGVALNALLGPLATGVIEYRLGEAMLNHVVGLDAVALLVAAPAAVVSAWLVHRERMLGPVLAFLPALFAVYTGPQYVVGPDYSGLAGNNEHFFLLHLGLFLVGMTVALLSWQHIDRLHLVPNTRPSDQRRAVLLVMAAGLVLVRWMPDLTALVGMAPTDGAFADNPTALLLVALLDLGVVVPATLTAALGLWHGAVWGRPAAYAAIGFHAVVTLAAAAMAVTLFVNGDPSGSILGALLLSFVAVLASVAAVVLYSPVRGERIVVVPSWWAEEHSV